MGPGFAFCQAYHRLNQGMVITVQSANLIFFAQYLDQKVLSALQESLGLFAAPHAAFSANILVVEIPHQDEPASTMLLEVFFYTKYCPLNELCSL